MGVGWRWTLLNGVGLHCLRSKILSKNYWNNLSVFPTSFWVFFNVIIVRLWLYITRQMATIHWTIPSCKAPQIICDQSPSGWCTDIFIKFPRGAFEILDVFWQILDLLKKLWTFQYAAGFRGPGILIKRSTIVDLSVYAVWLRGPDITQNIQKRFKNITKIDCRAFTFSCRRYVTDNRTAHDIPNFGPFWVV